MASEYSSWIAAVNEQENELADQIKNMVHYEVACISEPEKYEAVAAICSLNLVGRIIVFCKAYNTANWLAKRLTENGQPDIALLGGTDDSEEPSVNNKKIMIATDKMAESSDVGQVTTVVNYDLPLDVFGEANNEIYFQRLQCIGAGKSGRIINLVRGSKQKRIIKAISNRFSMAFTPLKLGELGLLQSDQPLV